MKNKNIKQQLRDELSAVTASISPGEDLLEKIHESINKINPAENNNKITRKFLLKPLLAAAALVLLAMTAAAAAPLILRMMGSDIAFFESDMQLRYSADYELIKQYSSKVGVTEKKDGFGFTVDNIAFDGTFMSVFYTIKNSDVNLYEEVKADMEKWGEKTAYYVQNAIVTHPVELEIPGHTLLHDTYIYAASDGYFASDYELKAVKRFIITDDLPDVFDVNVKYLYYNGRPEFWPGMNDDGTFDMPVPITVSLTLDMRESKLEKLTVNPGLSAKIVQPRTTRFPEEYEISGGYDDEYARRILAGDFDEDEDIDYADIEIKPVELYPDFVEHNIVIDRVSISPLGNIFVITDKGSESYVNRELFGRYFILDDKGNFYRRYGDVATRREWEEDTTTVVEFFGNVPDDIEYLKLVPYKIRDFDVSNVPEMQEADLNSLPASLKQSEYGSIIIESYTVTDNEFIFTYRYDGIISERSAYPILTVKDGEAPLLGKRGYTSTKWIYDRHTETYTYVYTFPNPIENLRDIIKGISIFPIDIELMEDQTVIIPLK